ncbi:sugar ABC transporter substrate-binding protein [Butyricicoccus faecihominis]|uniref:sugar ABC transporter substrate-binding protein n=1 Tax=Butyricicoccus faecihominis TaxID=1712515 RepID=UPI0024791EE4|nr:sugar ABC transporter substrate-binding protein [Butyricicoccus faecihominis]MCQ5129222.1 sugar ABC transporter substrate-binding protein [Butyricicoccus faecihominis]
MKKTMRKRIAVLLAGAIMMAMVSGCGGDSAAESDGAAGGEEKTGGYTIGFTNMADTDVFCKYTMDQFVQQAGEKGWSVTTADANLDTFKQIQQVDTFIASEVDAIVIEAVDYEAIVPGIEAANEAGIPVICLICDAAGGDFIYIGSDNYQCGQAEAEFFNEALPENAKIVYLAGTPGLNHSTLRHQGFFENFDRDDVEVLAELSGNFEREEGMKIMQDWLQAYPQIDGVVSANDQMALGAIQAMKAANRLEGVVICGVDATEDGMQAIKDGEMTGSMLYNGIVQAENAILMLEKIFNGDEIKEKRIISPFELVTADNVDEYSQMVYGKTF